MNEWILISLVAALEALLHYIPWKRFLRGRELPRLVAYILGVLALMTPFSIWLIEHDQLDVFIMLWKVILAGGITVTALYGLDHYVELVWRDMEASEREQVMTKQMRDKHVKG
jgi:hypothetical protein